VNAEAGGAISLLAGAEAFGDVTGDRVVAGGESCCGYVDGLVAAGELAAAGAPRIGGLLSQIKIGSRCGDRDGITRKDVGWLSSAAELNRRRGIYLAEAKNSASGDAV